MTRDCYHVRFHGPLTAITSSDQGPWPRWEMARAAAIEHLELHVRECQRTLTRLRRAGNAQDIAEPAGEFAQDRLIREGDQEDVREAVVKSISDRKWEWPSIKTASIESA